jgi:hypothetical protein
LKVREYTNIEAINNFGNLENMPSLGNDKRLN